MGENNAYIESNSISRHNFGINFRFKGRILNDVDFWTHSFEIDLSNYKIPKILIGNCQNQTAFLCLFRKNLVTQFNDLSEKIEKDIADTHDLVAEILGKDKNFPRSNSRSKRALFSFIGDVAKGLFDVATTEDINKLASHVDKLYNFNKKTANN